MKTTLSVLILLLLGVISHQKLTAQINTVEINFNTKKVTIPENIQNGELYNVNITDINLNLYKVSIDNIDSTISSSVEFPTFDMVGLSGLTKLLTNLTGLTTLSQSILKNGNRKNGNRNKDNRNKDTITLSLINEKISLRIIELQRQIDELNNINNFNIDSLYLKVKTLYLSYFANDSTLKYKLKGDFNYTDIIKTSDECRSKVKGIIKSIETDALSYTEYYNLNKPAIENDTILKRIDSELKMIYISTIDSAFKIYKSIGSETIGWLNSIIHLENNSKTNYLSLPFQLNGDVTNLTIIIEPKDDVYGLPKYQTKLRIPKPNNIYIGTGISFYTTSLYNDAFSVKTTIIDSVTTDYSIIDEKPNKMEIGIATLLHFGFKMHSGNIGFNASIGPAFSISTTIKPRLAIGAGFSFGKKQMLNIGVIGMGGYVDRKSEVFTTNKSYNSEPQQITVSKLGFGWGLSFGYIYNF